MKNYSTAFCTVLFPGNAAYFDDFFKSIQSQTVKNFDLVIVNDGIKNLNSLLEKYGIERYVELDSGCNPIQNRAILINSIIAMGYEYAIFGDSDDYFCDKRVEICLKLLTKYDLVTNDIDMVSHQGAILKESYISERFDDGYEISINDILTKNFIGLSNTAIKIKSMPPVILDNRLIAVDWYLFSNFLLSGKNAIFTNRVKTFYRQHGNNTVGFSDISKDSIRQSLEVKKIHYLLMVDSCTSFKIVLSTFLIDLNIDLDSLYNKSKEKHRSNCLLWWEY